MLGLRKDASVQKTQSRTTGKEREDIGTGSERMNGRKLIAGARRYCSRISIGLELCKCQQEPLTTVLDAGG